MTFKDEMKESPAVEVKKVPLCGSTRLGIAFIAFFGFLNLYALRANMSVAIVCMVNHTAVKQLSLASDTPLVVNNASLSDNTSATSSYSNALNTTQAPDQTCQYAGAKAAEDGSLVFDKSKQGLILSSFFWGYIITMFPGGWLATHFGGKKIFCGFMIGTGIATLLTPIAAQTHYTFLIVVRFVVGLGSGVAYPAMHAIWGHWAPPIERSKLLGLTFAGSWLGNVVTYPAAGLLCKYGFAGGWPSIFYIFGGLCLIWCLVWGIFVTDYPDDHRRISEKERNYIYFSHNGQMGSEKKGGLSSADQAKKSRPPFKAIFTSAPVWALIVVNTCSDWGLYTFLTNLPTYLKDVLQFDIQSNGLYSALPFLGFWLMTMLIGWFADFLREHKYLSTTAVRKLCQGTGFIIPAILIVPVGYLHCDQAIVAIVLLTLCVSMTGWQFGGGFLINAGDFAPKYSGIIFGISNSIATISGFFVPVVIGAITKDGTREQWRAVFYIAAAVYVVGAIIFFILGSGDVQPWANEEEEEDERKPMNVELKSVEKTHDDLVYA